jgi:TrmH family RNA methyltransferase
MVDDLHGWGFETLVADIRAEQYYHQMEFPKKAALVVSNEANGPQLIKQGDKMVKIPLYQEAESLNVAIAAGILLYAIKTSR